MGRNSRWIADREEKKNPPTSRICVSNKNPYRYLPRENNLRAILSSCLSERNSKCFAAGEVEAGGARSAQACSRTRSFVQRPSDRVKLTWVPVRRREVRSLTCWPHRPARGRCGCGSRCSMRESQRQWAQCAPMIVRSTILSGQRVSGSVWAVVACSSCPSVPLGHMQGRQHCLP